MKCYRVGLLADVEAYEVGKGMEDGFEPYHNVVMHGWIIVDSLVKVTREDGVVVCPYIKHRRGRTFINEGDYIIVEEDGSKHACGSDKIFKRYHKVEE